MCSNGNAARRLLFPEDIFSFEEQGDIVIQQQLVSSVEDCELAYRVRWPSKSKQIVVKSACVLK